MSINKFKKIHFTFEKIFLRPVMRKDVYGDWWKWLNNGKITELMDKGYEKNTISRQLRYYQKIQRSKKDLFIRYMSCKSKTYWVRWFASN